MVDGQQRLTTLTILLTAIRDRRDHESPEHFERINEPAESRVTELEHGSGHVVLELPVADRRGQVDLTEQPGHDPAASLALVEDSAIRLIARRVFGMPSRACCVRSAI